MNDFFNNQRILNLIWKRKFHFILIGIIAIILSAIFSGPAFITPKFKSTARIYPTSNVAVFSEESRTEQMLEILNSRDIKLRMIKTFGLDTVYKVDKESPQFLSMMLEMYNSHVSASKTKFETVEIEVLDKDPMRAAQMCDSIIQFYNEKIGGLHSFKHVEVYNLLNKFIEDKIVERDSVSVLLQQLRDKTGIISVYNQLDKITEGYMLALSNSKGGTSDTKEIKNQLNNIRAYGDELSVLERQFNKLSRTVDSLNISKEIELLEINKDITYCHIVEYPIPADKKSYPVRWLIVAFSALSAVFIALLVFLVLDYRK